MTKDWGIVRRATGSGVEYLLDTGEWLPDADVYEGAPLRLFVSSAQADAFADEFPYEREPHAVRVLPAPAG